MRRGIPLDPRSVEATESALGLPPGIALSSAQFLLIISAHTKKSWCKLSYWVSDSKRVWNWALSWCRQFSTRPGMLDQRPFSREVMVIPSFSLTVSWD
jgi:hypothetical protein